MVAAGSRSGTTASTPSGTTGVNSVGSSLSTARRAAAAPADAMPRNTFTRVPLRATTTPGLSGVPASRLPTITVSAPAAMALATSPPARMPPSAITGTPCGATASAHSRPR